MSNLRVKGHTGGVCHLTGEKKHITSHSVEEQTIDYNKYAVSGGGSTPLHDMMHVIRQL